MLLHQRFQSRQGLQASAFPTGQHHFQMQIMGISCEHLLAMRCVSSSDRQLGVHVPAEPRRCGCNTNLRAYPQATRWR